MYLGGRWQVAKWRGGKVVKWQSGKVAGWQGGKVAGWQVAGWQGGRVVTMLALGTGNGAVFQLVPNFGWRIMFVIGGIGALIVWMIRKSLPESPRWLESAACCSATT